VHEIVSRLTNRFLSVTETQTLGFGSRRFFLAIAGLLVFIYWEILLRIFVFRVSVSAVRIRAVRYVHCLRQRHTL